MSADFYVLKAVYTTDTVLTDIVQDLEITRENLLKLEHVVVILGQMSCCNGIDLYSSNDTNFKAFGSTFFSIVSTAPLCFIMLPVPMPVRLILVPPVRPFTYS